MQLLSSSVNVGVVFYFPFQPFFIPTFYITAHLNHAVAHDAQSTGRVVTENNLHSQSTPQSKVDMMKKAREEYWASYGPNHHRNPEGKAYQP